MAELCPKHQLMLAPDGKCVLCRRTRATFSLPEASEGWGSRMVTLLLGLGMVVALAGVILVQSPTQSALPMPEPSPTPQAPSALPEAEEAPPSTAPPEAGEPARARVQLPWEKAGIDRLSFEARRSEVELVMYAAPWCYICDGARTFLVNRGVTLVEHDIELDTEAMDRLARLNPAASVPTFILDGETIVGFNAWDLADRIDDMVAEQIVAQR